MSQPGDTLLPSAAGRATAAAAPPLRTAVRTAALALAVSGGLGPFLLSDAGSLTTLFFRAQDAPWLAVGGLALLIATALPARRVAVAWTEAALSRPGPVSALAAAFAIASALVGTILVMRCFPLSYDEVMAEFDTAILRQGRLVAAVAPEWRPFANSLVPFFRLPVAGDAAWVSSYLPGNAALRALMATVHGEAWTGPLLAGISALATYRIARRLWPERPDAAAVAVILLATSPQVLVTAMTPYSMTAHLALNLVWLSLFLRNDRAGHLGAVSVGFLACGLHQVVFHPLFVGPFVLQLLGRRRWGLVLFYVLAYGMIGAFWVEYWGLALAWSDVASEIAVQAGPGLFLERVLEILRWPSLEAVDLMAKNLLRFVAWQNPLALPLAVLAGVAIRRAEGITRPLLAGVLVTAGAAFLLMPYQGHGWGYRYLHGAIGSLCLLAARGWIGVTCDAASRRAALPVLAAATIFSAAILLPGRLHQVARFVWPYADAVEAIRRAPADVVVVDPSGMAFGADLVRNDPFLRNRPIVLGLQSLSEAALRSICGRFRVALFDRRHGAAYGIGGAGPSLESSPGHAMVDSLGCAEPLPLPPDAR
jgi:hypothetical protein